MKLLHYLFQKRMVLVLFLIFVSINLCANNYMHYGINKTVGWAFDISEYSPIIFLFSFYSYLLVYGIFALSKKETTMAFSMVHTLIITVSVIFLEMHNNGFLMICNCVSFIMFMVNVLKSLKSH
jgi:hypothetical protein